MSKAEKQEVQTLTRGELMRELSEGLWAFGDDGIIIEIAEQLGYTIKKQHHGLWTLYEEL